MSKITYNADSLKLMSLFENVTRTRIKDYFVDDNDITTFVVDEVFLGKAIGKQAVNVKKLEQMLGKRIRMIGFNQDPAKFAKNLIYPMKAEIEVKENIIYLKGDSSSTKAMLIGRNQSNIKNNLNIIKKYFKEIVGLKVV
ncbi:MAG: NusA-like transcription termination signal-binding factor [archaeon]